MMVVDCLTVMVYLYAGVSVTWCWKGPPTDFRDWLDSAVGVVFWPFVLPKAWLDEELG